VGIDALYFSARAGGPEQLPPPDRTGEDIGRHIDEILSRPEFRPPSRSLLQRIFDFVAEVVSDLLSTVVGGGRGSLIGLVLVIAFIGALIAIWVRFVPTMSRDPSTRGDGGDVERRRPATDWNAEADGAAAAGRWRDALRYRYRALIARLAEVGVIEEVPGRTAGEYRHELHRALPIAAAEFARATDLFEQTWYGGQLAGSAEHAVLVDLSRRVLTRAPL
jgi:hypothetical protein